MRSVGVDAVDLSPDVVTGRAPCDVRLSGLQLEGYDVERGPDGGCGQGRIEDRVTGRWLARQTRSEEMEW